MILGIDAHNIRGNGGSLIHLMELLTNADPLIDNFERIIVWLNTETFKYLPQKKFIEYKILNNRNSISSLIWQKFILEKEAKENNCSILFIPGGIYLGNFNPFIAFAQSMLPFDKNAQNLYKYTTQYWVILVKRILMIYTFQKASSIIFVSNSIKKQIEKAVGKEINNSKVIHHGVNERFKITDIRLQKKEKDKINLLVDSSHALHKNLIPLVKIIGELRKENYNIELKIVGTKAKFGTDELLKTIKLVDSNNDFIKIITDEKYEDLPNHFNEADVFIAPSLCESFGLPLKEALVNQIPILHQKLGSFDEIIEDFKPKSTCISYENIELDFKQKLINLISQKNDQNYTEIQKRHFWASSTRETFRYLKNVIADNVAADFSLR
ncbi:MAG: glycosyltransferase [Ignavibacteriae bacterium]|nr:glycosyltransferase [Ignavibacteriota bacterium]